MSLAASDAAELSGSINDPAPLPPTEHSEPKPDMDAEVIRILPKAVEGLGLVWSQPEEPTRSHLDEWFLLGCHQAPRQRASPFFAEVHDELTKTWRAPYSAHLCASSSSALKTVDNTGEKGYKKMPPLDESVATHLCPPMAIGWKAKVAHPSKPCNMTSDLTGRAYASFWTSGLGTSFHCGLTRLSDQTPPEHRLVLLRPSSF